MAVFHCIEVSTTGMELTTQTILKKMETKPMRIFFLPTKQFKTLHSSVIYINWAPNCRPHIQVCVFIRVCVCVYTRTKTPDHQLMIHSQHNTVKSYTLISAMTQSVLSAVVRKYPHPKLNCGRKRLHVLQPQITYPENGIYVVLTWQLWCAYIINLSWSKWFVT